MRRPWDTPWTVCRDRVSVQAGRVRITQSLGAPRGVMEANARLIHAAPDMHNALDGALELIEADGWKEGDGLGGEIVMAIVAALKKARGDLR